MLKLHTLSVCDNNAAAAADDDDNAAAADDDIHFLLIGKTKCLLDTVMTIIDEYVTNTCPNISYIAFNKSTHTEFKDRISKTCGLDWKYSQHTDIRTLHSLCYEWFRETYKGKSNTGKFDISSEIKVELVVEYLHMEDFVKNRLYKTLLHKRVVLNRIRYEASFISNLILKTLNNYLNSSSTIITNDHIDYKLKNPNSYFEQWTTSMDKALASSNAVSTPAHIYYSMDTFNVKEYATKLFLAAESLRSIIPMTHSIYQKLVQLQNGVLSFKQHDMMNMILVDEAQDLNECQYHIIENQCIQGSTIIIVGDPNQSIYQFAGACDQFIKLDVDREEMLTESFRFGHQIAMVCNIMLGLEKIFSSSRYYDIKSWTTRSDVPIKSTVHGQGYIDDSYLPPKETLEYPYTLICRKNNSCYFSLLSILFDHEKLYEEMQKRKHGLNNPIDGLNNPIDGFNDVRSDSIDSCIGKRNIIGKDDSPSKVPCNPSLSSNATSIQLTPSKFNEAFIHHTKITSNSSSSSYSAATPTTTTAGYRSSSSSNPKIKSTYTSHTLLTPSLEALQVPVSSSPQVAVKTERFNDYIKDESCHSGLTQPMQSLSTTQNNSSYHHHRHHHHHNHRHQLSNNSDGKSDGMKGTTDNTSSSTISKQIISTTTKSNSAINNNNNSNNCDDDKVVKPDIKVHVNGISSFDTLDSRLFKKIERLLNVNDRYPYSYNGGNFSSIDELKHAAEVTDDVAMQELIIITKKWVCI